MNPLSKYTLNLTEIAWARLATAVDTDGSICLVRNNSKTGEFIPTVQIGNTCKEFLFFFRELVGFGYLTPPQKPIGYGKKSFFYLTWRYQQALIITLGIFKYLIIKKDKAEKLFSFYQRTCIICEKEFFFNQSSRQKTCSKNCRKRHKANRTKTWKRKDN